MFYRIGEVRGGGEDIVLELEVSQGKSTCEEKKQNP
jgi:hypothetical protein